MVRIENSLVKKEGFQCITKTLNRQRTVRWKGVSGQSVNKFAQKAVIPAKAEI